MAVEIVLEGDGTIDEMEAHLIRELKERDWLTGTVAGSVVFESSPEANESGPYRIRIPAPV